MDVFAVRDRLINDYSEYVRSFIRIRDTRIEREVLTAFNSGLLWPDPLIQLNPAFEPGDSVDGLVEAGVLHEECGRVFRKDKEPVVNIRVSLCGIHRPAIRALHV